MSNVYQDFRSKIGYMIVVIWPVALVGVILSTRVMWEDYLSTVFAYDQIPTYEVSEGEIGYIVAGLLWASQLVFAYIFFTDTSRVWAKNTALMCAALDIASDTWYKMGGEWNLALFPWAITLSIVVFTVVSELVFTIFLGFIIQTAGDFISVLFVAVNGVLDAILELFGVGGDNNKPNNKPNNINNINKPPSKPSKFR